VKTADMRKERSKKVNILMCIAAVLVCATLFSMRFAGGLLAGFSKTESGGDSARVAVFNIVEDGTFFKTMEIAVTPGSSQSEGFTVKNNSEVSMKYTLTIAKKTNNLPMLTFKLNDNKFDMKGNSENGESTTTIECTLPPNQTNEYNLEAYWDPDSDENKDLAFMGMVDDITITVKAEQID